MTFSPLRRFRKFMVRALPSVTGSNQKVFATVMQGLRATLEDSRFDMLVSRINEIEPEWRGFAYEGAGVGLVIFDYLLPWKRRLPAFVRGPGSPYTIPIYIGAGLALARFNSRRPEKFLTRLENSAFHWMVIDGYGFAKGYFAQQRHIQEQVVPDHLSAYGHRVFDQGLGRSIWFVCGEHVEQVAETIARFPEARQADLWSGAAFACTYAGSAIERQELERMVTMAGPYRLQLAVAAALAAKRRHGLGHITPHTEMSCQVLSGLSGEQAAFIADQALESLPTTSTEALHKIWRERIQARLAAMLGTHNDILAG